MDWRKIGEALTVEAESEFASMGGFLRALIDPDFINLRQICFCLQIDRKYSGMILSSANFRRLAVELAVKAEIIDVVYRLAFKEPLLHFLGGEQRLALLKSLLSLFELRLNDLRFNDQNISTDHIHFSKFYGSTFLNVSFGLEEVEASINRAQEEGQIKETLRKIHKVVSDSSLAWQKMTIRCHFSSQEDVSSYLRGLVGNIPAKFEPSLQTTGVSYTLKVDEGKLTTNVTAIGSQVVPGGLLLIVDNEFFPSKYDFEQTYEISKQNFDMVSDALGIQIKESPNVSK
jgi:hypothetical protein